MKWTTISKSGKTARTWDSSTDNPWLEIIFSATEGNPFAQFILTLVGVFIFLIIIFAILSIGGLI